MFLSLKEWKLSFDAYDCFVARRVYVKVICDDGDVMRFIAMCDLWDWKYYNVKLNGDVAASMVRVEMVAPISFWGKWVILCICTM